MKSNRLFNHLAAAVLLSITAFETQAAVVISNYAGSNDNGGPTEIAAGVPFFGEYTKSAGFTMGGADYTLDSVTLRLEVGVASSTVNLTLFGDVAGAPGGLALGTFTSPALVAGIGDFTFTPTSAVTLQAGTTYWIATSGNNPIADSGVTWLSSSPAIVPTGIATSAGYHFNDNSTFPATGPNPANAFLNSYQVNGTVVAPVVPEPGTALFGLALAGVAMVRRRR